MKDTLISFETAILAEELNFNINTLFTYSPQKELFHIVDLKYPTKAPTQSLLQKWLRENHNIHISIDFAQANDGSINWYIQISEMTWIEKDLKYTKINKPIRYFKLKSYEQALEKGLYEALKLIKNEK